MKITNLSLQCGKMPPFGDSIFEDRTNHRFASSPRFARTNASRSPSPFLFPSHPILLPPPSLQYTSSGWLVQRKLDFHSPLRSFICPWSFMIYAWILECCSLSSERSTGIDAGESCKVRILSTMKIFDLSIEKGRYRVRGCPREARCLLVVCH